MNIQTEYLTVVVCPFVTDETEQLPFATSIATVNELLNKGWEEVQMYPAGTNNYYLVYVLRKQLTQTSSVGFIK